MIKCHLSRIMGEKRLRISNLVEMTGLHRNSITLLYHEKASRVDLETINQLCRVLECKPGDLFEYIPSDK